MRIVRRVGRVIWTLSSFGSGILLLLRILDAPEAITIMMPIVDTMWPIIGFALVCGSLVGTSGLYKEWDKNMADIVRNDLERFVEVGNKKYHPILRTINVTAKPEIILKAIAKNYHKWLGTITPDGKLVMSMATVNKAIERIESLKLYGFTRTRWLIYWESPHWWDKCSKSKQNP